MGYSFLQQSIRDGSLASWWAFGRWNQTFNDLSGNARNLTTISNVWWGGGGLQFANATGYCQRAGSPYLAFTAQTLVIMGNFKVLERASIAPSHMMVLEDIIGGPAWRFGIDDTPRLRFEDNAAAARTCAFNYTGMRTVGITMTNGGTPIGYGNGLSQGNFSGTVAIGGGAPTNNLYVGNRRAADRSMLNPMHAALIFNDVLTATEMSQVHGELMSLPGGEH